MRILIVEDEHRIANNIKKGLEQEHYAVDVAYDGEAGLDLASSEDYDLLILDLMLPKLGGLEICKKIREANNHVPILILTAKAQIRDKVEGLDNGADDYLTKPFNLAELEARLRALIRRGQDSVGGVMEFGNLRYDMNGQRVFIDNKPVELSAREIGVFQILALRAGRVVNKEQLLNHLCSYDEEVLPNAIEVYVHRLRKKLEKSQITIRTVHGLGYLLEKPHDR